MCKNMFARAKDWNYLFVYQWGLGKFWDIHTMEYSAAVKMKDVSLTVRIYNKLPNILLNFTKEQRKVFNKGRGNGAYMLVYSQNVSGRTPKKYNSRCLCGKDWEIGRGWQKFTYNSILFCTVCDFYWPCT